ncbi:MAG: radical SAM protein [Bacteroidales bacterium]|nr:radical SAM protein [Bacteroidales bacterium]
MAVIKYQPFYSHASRVYNLPGFGPGRIDREYLRSLGVAAEPSGSTLQGLERGSEVFARRFSERTLIPLTEFRLEEADIDSVVPEIHNYTGRCPALTYEINPVRGCGVGCQYCLVTDGVHEQELVAIDNYHLYVRTLLERFNGPGSDNANHYYYFSPKTEAFQEATLLSGIAHRVLQEFIDHFERFPASRARLFVASKAGVRHLEYRWNGVSVLELFSRLSDRMQFNTSVSIMPDAFRDILEPYAAPLSERLAAVKLCRDAGIQSNSALVQPIVIPYLTREHIEEFFTALSGAGIINYKPEFLTACMENLAMLGQYLGYFDKGLEKELYDAYLSPSNADHLKQRGRTAPDRAMSVDAIRRMSAFTDTLGMSVSICYWVRKQLGISEEDIPLVNRNGFQCLGYQRRLFPDVL